MAEEIGALRAMLSASSAQFETDMNRARKAVEINASGMERAMLKVKAGFGGAMNAMAAITGVAAVWGAAMAAMVRGSINTADQLSKLSQSTGVSIEKLSALKYAAELSDVSLEDLAKALVMTAKRADDASEAYASLGIAVRNSDGSLRGADELMVDVAEKFSKMEDGAGKTALAVELFGKSGASLIPLLNSGRDGIKEMADEAERLGLILDTKTGQAAERFNDNLTRLNATKTGLVNTITAKVLPTLTMYTNQITESAQKTGSLKIAAEAGAAGFKLLISSGVLVVSVFKTVGQVLGGVSAELAAMLSGDFKGAAAIDKQVFDDLVGNAKKAYNDLHDIWETPRKKLVRHEIPKPEPKPGTNKAPVILPMPGLDTGKTTKAVKEARDAAGEMISKMWEEAATFGKSEKEITLYRMALEGATEDQIQYASVLLDSLISQKQHADLVKEGEAVTSEVRTATEIYADEIKRLNALLDAGVISQETYNRAFHSAYSALVDVGDQTEETSKQFEALGRVIEGWAQDSADAMTDFVLTGKSSFTDLVDTMIRDMMRMIVYQQLTGPLAAGVNSFLGGGGFMSGWSGFGGGKASGGPVSSGKMYEVNERGAPELLNIGNRQFLMMAGQSGRVTPTDEGGTAGGLTISVPVTVGERNPLMQAELRREIETTVERVVRRHS
jgi:ribosomal protein L12E/L44/L45/RPP1/RPP2